VGISLTAACDLEPGTVLGEYTGQLVKSSSANHPLQRGFIQELTDDMAIDCSKSGNELRFITSVSGAKECYNCRFCVACIRGQQHLLIVSTKHVAKGEVLIAKLYSANSARILDE